MKSAEAFAQPLPGTTITWSSLRSVHVRSPNEVYAVGAGGTIIRLNEAPGSPRRVA